MAYLQYRNPAAKSGTTRDKKTSTALAKNRGIVKHLAADTVLYSQPIKKGVIGIPKYLNRRTGYDQPKNI